MTESPLQIEPSVDGLFAAESIHNREFSMEFQEHRFHEIFALVRGRIQVVLGNGSDPGSYQDVDLRSGGFLLISSLRPHRIIDQSAATLFILCIDEAVPRRDENRRLVWDSLVAEGPVPIYPSAAETKTLHDLFREQLALQRKPAGLDRAFSVMVNLDRLLLSLFLNREHHRIMEQGEARVRRFSAELPERVHERWTVERAAVSTALSRRRFTELFRGISGETFSSAVTRLRLERACESLRSGDVSIAGAAFSAGFEDLSHFYRQFGRRYGMPPGTWLRENTSP